MNPRSTFSYPFALVALLTSPILTAGIPEPDTVLFGSIALDGQYVTAAHTSVSVELRASANGPALRSYRMGSNPRAGNLYVLRAAVESAPPLLQPDAIALGSTVHLVVRDASGVRDSATRVLTERGGFVRIDFGDVDGDGDGMSDAFESSYFGGPNAGNALVDTDNDGRPNLREFLDKTDPLVPDGRHPADRSPADNAIGIAEVTAYTLAWQLGEEWPTEPKVIPVDYVTRAGALWKGGETYVFDNVPTTVAPLWWVNPPPSPALASANDAEGTPAEGILPALKPARTSKLMARAPETTEASAVRIAPANYRAAEAAAVRIRVAPKTGTLSYAVEETPPEGWIIRNVSHGGRIDRVHRKIKWGPFYDTEARDLTYEVTPLPGTSGDGLFAGLGSFDGQSLALGGTRQMLPPGASAPPSLASVAAENGRFRVRLTGTPGARYAIEASPDLRVWTPVQTVGADENGTVDYSVSRLGLEHRFFRARVAD
ncbi:MAG: hypothetical protein JNL97_12070 [Verrucomicrobiales bacterium]|nr:hypothetical protein [Verrucomicrobiales bacterium]